MKLVIILTVVACIHVHAASFGQKVSINVEEASMENVLNHIKSQTGFKIFYKKNILSDIPKISLHLNNASISQVLDACFKNRPFTYMILDNTIGIKKKELSSFIPQTEIEAPQPILISGKVTDSAGKALSGVSIFIKGTKSGTVTDDRGEYSIKITGKTATLVYSFIGYDSKEVEITGKSSVENVTLKVAESSLAQLVVIGYGSQKKADVTGAIASVQSSAITRAAVPDATGALQGNVPGVVVVKNVGKPGSGYSIDIRGTNSIGGSNDPLYVIDGVPTTSGLNELNPADIESIDVLKDASATAIYGSRGAKGVVIVTTKHGKAGKAAIYYDAYMGEKVPTHLPEMFSGKEYVALRTQMFEAQGKSTDKTNTAFFTAEQWANIDAGRYTDWPQLVLKNALQMNHNITVSGGDARTRFSIGAGLLEEGGNVAPEGFKRYTLRGNVDREINDHWKVGLNFYLSQNLQDQGSFEALRSSYRLPPMTYPYDSSGRYAFHVYGANAVTNPFFDEENDLRQNRYFTTFGSIYVQLKPIKNLTLKSTIYPSYYASRTGTYYGPLSKQGLGTNSGATNSTDEKFTWVLDNQATYDANFGDHKLTATVVQSLQKDRDESNTISVDQLPYKSLWYNVASGGRVIGVGSNFTQSTLASFMGRVNYGYKDKYLVTATGRSDGSSRLAEGNKWGFFPSASLAWRLSKEAFLENVNGINDLKLRLSYGVTGNDRVDPYSTQATLGQTYYDFGGILAGGYAPSQLPNKNLTWEMTHEINLGLDYVLINNRISGSIDVYDRKIKNILLNRKLPAPSGWSSVVDNVGKLQNKGIEVGLSTINIKNEKFRWQSNFVFDMNKNKILELSTGKNDDVGSLLFIGQPVQVNYDYVFDGVWQTNQADQAAKYNQTPGQIRVQDLNNDGVINASDKAIIGKRVPSWTGSFANTFSYGNFDLYIMVYTRKGEQFNSSFDATLMNYNSDYNQVKVNYWTPDNPSNTHFEPGNPGPYAGIANYRKADFTRISNITLGYKLPDSLLKRFGITSFRIYATATNPFVFTDYQGFDPEWMSQNSFGTDVSAASYLLGVNVSF